jgi:integrase
MSVGKVNNSSITKLDGWLWDQTVQGFGARRQRNGVYFYVRYRANGSQVVRSIGRLGVWTCDTARTEAKRLLGIVASGQDPHAKPLASENFTAAVDQYLERKRASLKPRSFEETRRYLTKSAAPLHRLKLAEVDRRQIALVLAEIERSSGPSSRNRARAALSAFFSWTITEGLLSANPVQGTATADEGNSRDRVLSVDELRRLWRGLGEGRFSDIIRLLLLTGQRRTEIGSLRWSEIDLGRKMIVLLPERTKNGRGHEVPLSTQALAVINRQPRRNTTEYIFSDASGFRDWNDAKALLDARIGIAPYRLHDLRRSAVTHMAEIGILPHVIEQCVNHQSGHKGGIAGVYNRSKMTDAVRDALQRWADHLDKIVA